MWEQTSSQAPSYASPKLWITHSLTGVKCRATSVAKKSSVQKSSYLSSWDVSIKQENMPRLTDELMICRRLSLTLGINSNVWLFQWRHITRLLGVQLTTTASTGVPAPTTSPSGSWSAGLYTSKSQNSPDVRQLLIGQSAVCVQVAARCLHKQILWPLISTWMPIALPAWMS